MSEEKQIDEMAKDLCRTDTCEIKKIGIPCNHRCKAHIYATRAVDKGYRKASDVAREILEEIEELTASVYNDFMFNRDGVGMNAHYVVQFSEELDIAIAELKKKYTEGK